MMMVSNGLVVLITPASSPLHYFIISHPLGQMVSTHRSHHHCLSAVFKLDSNGF